MPAATPKGFFEGTHRLVPPAETLRRIAPVAPGVGITRVANVTGLDRIGIPVVMVCRPNARSISVSQGKGLSLDAAKVSGLMESIELHHAEHVTLPLLLGSWRELCGDVRLAAVTRSPVRRGARFHRDLRMLWMEGRDLMSGEAVYVPYDLVHCDDTPTARALRSCFAASSNGLASGNHPLEAVSHALCEVIERDATARWAAGGSERRQGTRVDLASVEDPGCREVLDRYQRAKVDVECFETTGEVAVPSFYCVIRDGSYEGLGPLYAAAGFGCHPSRPVALLRALTEAAQSRVALIAGSRDDLFRSVYATGLDPDVQADQCGLAEGLGGGRRLDDGPGWEAPTFEEDVARQLACLGRAGVEEAVVVDLSTPRDGVAVVRVVVPGLEGSSAIGGAGAPGPGSRPVGRAAR